MARWTLEPIYGIRDKHQYSQFKSLDIYLKSFQNLLTRRKTDTRIEQESRANRCRGSADYSKNGKSSIRPGLENQAGVQAHMCRDLMKLMEYNESASRNIGEEHSLRCVMDHDNFSYAGHAAILYDRSTGGIFRQKHDS